MDRPEKSVAKPWIVLGVVVILGCLCCLGTVFLVPFLLFRVVPETELSQTNECQRNLANIFLGLV